MCTFCKLSSARGPSMIGVTVYDRHKTASAKRSICCGAGCEFWTLDRVPEPAVMLGYCGDPLEYCHTGVLWCWGGWLFATVWMELSEIPDIG